MRRWAIRIGSRRERNGSSSDRVATVTVMRDVHIVVPVLLHEIDWLATRVVLAAVLAPILRMPRWDVQVDRLTRHRHSLDDDRLCVDQPRRRQRTDIDTAIARLADADRNADIGSERWRSDSQHRHDAYETSHRELPSSIILC